MNGHLKQTVYGLVGAIIFAMLSWTIYEVHILSVKVTAIETRLQWRGAEIDRRLAAIETALYGVR